MHFARIFSGFVALGLLASFSEAQPTQTKACSVDAPLFADTTVDARDNAIGALFRPLTRETPRYPEAMKQQGVQAEVWASFIIDTLGHVVPASAHVSDKSHPAFGLTVCTFLQRLKVQPVRLDGHAATVRFVNMKFGFTLQP